MADNNKRVPVPAGGAPIPGAIENADNTPPVEGGNAEGGNAGGDQGAEEPPFDDGELVEARVLIAHGEHEPNDLMLASAAEIERLKLAGVVDDHADAVAFVKAG